jgi:site-specific recombinase XerD
LSVNLDQHLDPGSLYRSIVRKHARTTGVNAEAIGLYVHSLRATTATLLLDSSVAIESIQELLDHKHITTTQIYDKWRRFVRDSASRKVPI